MEITRKVKNEIIDFCKKNIDKDQTEREEVWIEFKSYDLNIFVKNNSFFVDVYKVIKLDNGFHDTDTSQYKNIQFSL